MANEPRSLGGPSDDHYARLGDIQPLEVIEAWGLPHHLACVIKYIARWEHKGGLEDLRKAEFYLRRFTELQETPKFTVEEAQELLTALHNQTLERFTAATRRIPTATEVAAGAGWPLGRHWCETHHVFYNRECQRCHAALRNEDPQR